MLEVMGQIQREQLAASKEQGEVAKQVALIQRDLLHLVESMGGRVASVERRIDAGELRVTNVESRAEARLTALEVKLLEKVDRVEETVSRMELTDAGRRGMVAGGLWVWGVLVGLAGVLGGVVGWLFTVGAPKT